MKDFASLWNRYNGCSFFLSFLLSFVFFLFFFLFDKNSEEVQTSKQRFIQRHSCGIQDYNAVKRSMTPVPVVIGSQHVWREGNLNLKNHRLRLTPSDSVLFIYLGQHAWWCVLPHQVSPFDFIYCSQATHCQIHPRSTALAWPHR